MFFSRHRKKITYTLLACAITVCVLVVSVLFPNRAFISFIFGEDSISLYDKINFLRVLITTISTYVTNLSGILMLFTAALIGINVSLAVYLIRNNITAYTRNSNVMTVFGITSAVVGYGCGLCGSLLFTTVFASVGGATLLAKLPLHGEEFGVLGVVVLMVATYLLYRQSKKPLVCSV